MEVPGSHSGEARLIGSQEEGRGPERPALGPQGAMHTGMRAELYWKRG